MCINPFASLQMHYLEERARLQATVRLSRVFNFENPYNVAGGTSAWAAAGYPVETDRQ